MVLSSPAITFLFTDVEGSTRLWEEHPEAMGQALARHDAILRGAIEGEGGVIFKALGDAFYAVFPEAGQALAAAMEAQRALHQEPWPSPLSNGAGGLRVRMALNTGAAEERGGDYFGPPLNRVARLLSAAHGGQILVSQTTSALLIDTLAEGAGLLDLGEHRLKDLTQPEHIFQLVHPELLSEFGPLRSLEAFIHNLPIQMTSFVGREREIASVRELLGETRLLTVTGAAGCGKTRLVLQVAAEVVEGWPHGVWLVDLASLADPVLVPQTIASILGVREEPGRKLLDTLADFLRPKSLLLVLDNCEHLLAACAELVMSLLQKCPQVRVLASSREGLGVPGEQIYQLPPFALPDPERLPPLAELVQHEAIRLFTERALLSQPRFVLSEESAPAVAQICHRLDGIPLAIELAAARVKVLPVQQIAERLHDRFRLLTGGSRTAMPRQQTLRAAVDWSYDLLSEPERALLRRLSAFSGGWTLEAMEAVCSGGEVDEFEVLDLLSHLVDKSLVVAKVGVDEETPYRLLLTVRHYGHDRLLEAGEMEEVRNRHCDWFLGLAREAEAQLQGARQGDWFNLLEADHDNLRSALEWSLAGAPESGLRMAGALWRFWFVRGYFTEGRHWLAKALTLGRPAPTAERAGALQGMGVLSLNQGDYPAARSCLEEGLEIWREIGDERGMAAALNTLGNLAWRHSEYERARGFYDESLEIERRRGDTAGTVRALINLANIDSQQGNYPAARTRYEEALAKNRLAGNRSWETAILHNLGEIAWDEGDYETARRLYEESLVIRRELGDRLGIARGLNSLGAVAFQQGDDPTARALYEEAVETVRAAGDRQWLALTLANLGNVVSRQGSPEAAWPYLRESLEIQRELGNRSGIAAALNDLAGLACRQEQWERSARLYGAAEAMREAIQAPLPPADRATYDRNVGQVRGELGPDRSLILWAEGRAMTLEGAIVLALDRE